MLRTLEEAIGSSNSSIASSATLPQLLLFVGPWKLDASVRSGR